jgi:predicted acetyltransferase
MLRQFKLAEDILLQNQKITEGYHEQIFSLLKNKPFWIWNEEQQVKNSSIQMVNAASTI